MLLLHISLIELLVTKVFTFISLESGDNVQIEIKFM